MPTPEDFYGLQRNPFRKAPDPDHLLWTPAVEEAVARLEHAAIEREIAVLTGGIGVGKTTATRALVDRLDGAVEVVWVMNPRLSPNQLLQQLALSLKIQPLPRGRVRLLDALAERMFQAWQADTPVVVLIDEAQMLPFPDTFEELRLLTNLQMDMDNLIGVLLVGQPELHRRLEHPRLAPLAQRIGVRFHLQPLDAEETAAYVHSRGAGVGREAPVFDAGAVTAIHTASRGIPRVINNVCGNALLAGFLAEADPIGADLIVDVAQDLGLEVA